MVEKHFNISIAPVRSRGGSLVFYIMAVIIISLSQSTARRRSLQLLDISLDLRLLASRSCQSFCANRHSTWPEDVLHYVYRDSLQSSFTPTVVRSTADTAVLSSQRLEHVLHCISEQFWGHDVPLSDSSMVGTGFVC
jgi:hypothetical protein